jgi:DNA-binding FadR family transcriptional regulator
VSSLSRDTRRIVVAHLTDRGMTPAAIAAELGVSRDTVRRDMEICIAPQATQTEPVAALPAPGLLLAESTQLRQDLNVLTTAFKAQPEDAARLAIHQLARHVRARWQARIDGADARQEART